MEERTHSAHATPTQRTSPDHSKTALSISDPADFGLGLVCIHALDGHLLSVSPAGAKVLGYRPEEMVGRRMQDFLPADVRDQLPAYLDKIQKDGTAAGLMRVLTKSGERKNPGLLEYFSSGIRESCVRAWACGRHHRAQES